MKHQTTVGAAMVAAGYKDAGERLDELALKAWSKFPGDGALAARIDFVVKAIEHEVTFELLNRANRLAVLTQPIEKLLADVRSQIEPARCLRLRAAPNSVNVKEHTRSWPEAATPRPAAGPAGRAGSPALQVKSAPGRAAPSRQEIDDRHTKGSRVKVGAILACAYDRIFIAGQKLGDLTAHEALGYAEKHEREARFIRLLCREVPLLGKIRDSVPADVADRLYDEASRSAAA